jgi:hypothetical protein
MSGAGQPHAGAVALAATYRVAVFFGVRPIAWRCLSAPVERLVDTLLRAALHFGIGGDDDD